MTNFVISAGVDYTNTVANIVTFSSGQTEASYQIPIVNDNSIESTETFTASLNTSESIVTIGNGTATITIVDEDSELFNIILATCQEEYYDYC